MRECYRVLKPGGKMILIEGVPHNERLKSDFIKIMNLKEERLTWMPEELEDIMVLQLH